MWNNSWKGEVFHNNTEFWSIAVSAADRVELEASADEHSRGQLHMWPRVFVYDLVPPFSDFNLSNASLHDIIGRPAGCSGHQHATTCSSFVWDTNQYGAANMLAWRVYHSQVSSLLTRRRKPSRHLPPSARAYFRATARPIHTFPCHCLTTVGRRTSF